ncbi:universal stress protein [Streptomyces sp. NPDC017993]|uniref:universal stress protein n=1 Tax=Streptomyces sp. NPDC017993 TaxID=3365027 RepID=UPI00378A3F34
MTVLVAVPDSAEGRAALSAAGEEARHRSADLVVINLGLDPLDPDALPADVPVSVRARSGPDLVDSVLTTLDEHEGRVDLLVIGLKRRTPVGKALLGSVSQQLLLEAEVPILAVKPER